MHNGKTFHINCNDSFYARVRLFSQNCNGNDLYHNHRSHDVHVTWRCTCGRRDKQETDATFDRKTAEERSRLSGSPGGNEGKGANTGLQIMEKSQTETFSGEKKQFQNIHLHASWSDFTPVETQTFCSCVLSPFWNYLKANEQLILFWDMTDLFKPVLCPPRCSGDVHSERDF